MIRRPNRGISRLRRYPPAMRALGIILLLVSIVLLAVHFMAIEVSALDFMKDLDANVAWAVRGGPGLLGLALMALGGKNKKKK